MNYLGQAKTLADSVAKHAPDHLFLYCLADKVNGRNLRGINPQNMIEVEQISIPNFHWMVKNYNIVEFATAVKPFFFNYLFDKYSEVNQITYLDPDIKIFTNLQELDALHVDSEVVMTPHFTVPITDNKIPTEKRIFSTGIYNLGFVSMKRGNNTFQLIDWWKEKLSYHCIVDLTRGYFVDQLWMVLAPIYFDKILVTKHLGMNMAHWNFHERILSVKHEQYFVQDFPLVFFHFSHYKPSKPTQLAAYHTRYSFATRTDLQPLYSDYHTELVNNHFFEFIKEPCFYLNNEQQKRLKKYWGNVMRIVIPQNIKVMLGKFLNK